MWCNYTAVISSSQILFALPKLFNCAASITGVVPFRLGWLGSAPSRNIILKKQSNNSIHTRQSLHIKTEITTKQDMNIWAYLTVRVSLNATAHMSGVHCSHLLSDSSVFGSSTPSPCRRSPTISVNIVDNF